MHEIHSVGMKWWTNTHSFMQIKTLCLDTASIFQIFSSEELSWEVMATEQDLQKDLNQLLTQTTVHELIQHELKMMEAEKITQAE